MGLFPALLWMSVPFLILILITVFSPRKKRVVEEVWSDETAVWKRQKDQTVDRVRWDDVKRVSVSQRENAFGQIERTYLLTTHDEIEHEFAASTIREEFLQSLRSLPGFEWDGFCDAVDASYPRTVICWKEKS